ncbi:S-adenosylmethionine decarboxylase [Carabus blaptoides fortunei]
MSDSDSENVQFFEGVEKLLEIWFASTDLDSKQCDLRKIPRHKLESLLKIVRCEIISFTRNEQVDAYVLSESSMFVSKRRFILKTCGTTTPLLCLKPLLLLAEQFAGYVDIENVFYSRKNFKRPELQMTPHQTFEQEVALLDTYFPDGAAYCLGPVNRDCWYLYTLNPPPMLVDSCTGTEPDQTLEILMTHLDPDIMALFSREECRSAAEATQKSGIDKLIPNMVIDDYLFDPCGYSMNGVSKTGCYMTIHITPEPEFSYVSFETNIAASSYRELISRVLDTFQPGNFVITVFANQNSVAVEAPREVQRLHSLGDWARRDIQHCRFKYYDLTCAFYTSQLSKLTQAPTTECTASNIHCYTTTDTCSCSNQHEGLSQNPCQSCKNDKNTLVNEVCVSNTSYCITHGTQCIRPASHEHELQNQLTLSQSQVNLPKCSSCQQSFEDIKPIRSRCYSNLTMSNSNSATSFNNGSTMRNSQLSRLFLCNLCVFSSTQAKLLFSWWRNKIS